jgi:cardiolipin synthase
LRKRETARQSGFFGGLKYPGGVVLTKTKVPLNIPNILTFFRFCLVPPAVICVYTGGYLISLILFCVACLTDLLDGFIARKYNMISEAGIVLDPLADKVMAILMVTALTAVRIYPLFVAIVIFVKEGLMIAGGIFLYKRQVVEPANIVGKAAALLFNVALGLALLLQIVGKNIDPNFYLVPMYAALVLTVIALLQYAYLNVYKKLAEKKNKNS